MKMRFLNSNERYFSHSSLPRTASKCHVSRLLHREGPTRFHFSFFPIVFHSFHRWGVKCRAPEYLYEVETNTSLIPSDLPRARDTTYDGCRCPITHLSTK